MDVEQVTSISWKENELNMVDTPGHADFGGEVYLSHDFFYHRVSANFTKISVYPF